MEGRGTEAVDAVVKQCGSLGCLPYPLGDGPKVAKMAWFQLGEMEAGRIQRHSEHQGGAPLITFPSCKSNRATGKIVMIVAKAISSRINNRVPETT